MHFAPQGLACKVCETGTLIPRKVLRLSGPAVAIGYILLIPSVVGMTCCALVLAGVFAGSGQPDRSAQNHQALPFVAPAAIEEEGCDAATKKFFPNADPSGVEAYCECSALQVIKALQTGSSTQGLQSCDLQAIERRLGPISPEAVALYYGPDVAALYTGENSQASPDAATSIFHAIGSGIALAMGIGFFVSGLLGWLLVMKKRVLKCDYCGAVVNAS